VKGIKDEPNSTVSLPTVGETREHEFGHNSVTVTAANSTAARLRTHEQYRFSVATASCPAGSNRRLARWCCIWGDQPDWARSLGLRNLRECLSGGCRRRVQSSPPTASRRALRCTGFWHACGD